MNFLATGEFVKREARDRLKRRERERERERERARDLPDKTIHPFETLQTILSASK